MCLIYSIIGCSFSFFLFLFYPKVISAAICFWNLDVFPDTIVLKRKKNESELMLI